MKTKEVYDKVMVAKDYQRYMDKELIPEMLNLIGKLEDRVNILESRFDAYVIDDVRRGK